MDQFAALYSGHYRDAGPRPLVTGKQNLSNRAIGEFRRPSEFMKRYSWFLLFLGLALIGATAGFLSHQRTHQKLGKPGVKVVAVPTYDNEGKLVASNSVYLPETVLGYKSEIRPITQDTLRWLPKDTTYGQRTYK